MDIVPVNDYFTNLERVPDLYSNRNFVKIPLFLRDMPIIMDIFKKMAAILTNQILGVG